MKRKSKPECFDLVVLGGGSGGYAAARTAAAEGLKVAVIEGGREIGGLCILRGCMPTKALLESSHRLHAIRHARDFGLRAAKPGADWKAVLKRKDFFIDDFAGYRRQQLESGKFEFIRGLASFEDPHHVRVTPLGQGHDRIVESKTFLISTGSVVQKVPVPGLEAAGYWTSDDAIRIDRPVKSLIVLGGGAIAVELAQHFSNLGTKVTLIQRSAHLLKESDADIAHALEAQLRDDGMKVICDTKLLEVRKKGKLREVIFEHGGRKQRAVGEHILYALGRAPNVKGLNLPAAKVALAKKGGVAIKPSMQSSQPHIFAAGDVCGPHEVVHLAITQGEVAARNAARLLRGEKKLETMDYRLHMEVVFTEPEIASVGMNEKEATERGIKYLAATYPFSDHGKSAIMGVKHGFVKILCDTRKGVILGCQIAGPHASDMIHEFSAVMFYKGTVHDVVKIPHYHPTLGEIVTYPAEELSEKLIALKK